MIKLPDLEAWAVFAKVAETGSLSKAAAELGLSNPTVSKSLTRLEGRLGAALFHRTSRRLSLTETGRASLARASAMLAHGEALEAEAVSGSAVPRGLVRMAAPMSFAIRHLGPALPGFMAAYPQVALELSLSDERVDLVTEGFDLALRIGALPDSSLMARRLCAVRMLLVGAPGYFARYGRPAHPRDLLGHVGLGYTYGPSRELWRFRHAEHGELSLAVPCPVRANNADVFEPLLLVGAGLALRPDFLVWEDVRAGRLEVVLEDWVQQEAGLHLVTPPSTLRPVRVTVLMEYLAQYFSPAPWVSNRT